MMKKYPLRPGEIYLLQCLWEAGRPLTQVEIMDLMPSEKFKTRTSVYTLLNSLMEMNLVKIDGFVRTGRNYGRSFVPTITYEEYALQNSGIFDEHDKLQMPILKNFVLAFVKKNSVSNNDIMELEAMIKELKDDNKK